MQIIYKYEIQKQFSINSCNFFFILSTFSILSFGFLFCSLKPWKYFVTHFFSQFLWLHLPENRFRKHNKPSWCERKYEFTSVKMVCFASRSLYLSLYHSLTTSWTTFSQIQLFIYCVYNPFLSFSLVTFSLLLKATGTFATLLFVYVDIYINRMKHCWKVREHGHSCIQIKPTISLSLSITFFLMWQ